MSNRRADCRFVSTTQTGRTLTAAQKSAYERDGFLVIPDFASAAECRPLIERAKEIVSEFDENSHRSVFSTEHQQRTSDDYFLTSGDKIRCFFEPDAFNADGSLRSDKQLCINKLGHALHELDPVFRRFSDTPALASIVKSLGYQQPQLVQSMYIFKQPSIGAPVHAHQDATFLFTSPQSVTGFWIALEDATVDNGCLYVVPGSHKQGTKVRFIRNPSGDGTVFEPPEEVKWNLEGAIPVEAPTGTLIVLHGDLVHYSLDNRSPKSRHAYTLHVVESAPPTQYPASNWLQRFDGKAFPGFTNYA